MRTLRATWAAAALALLLGAGPGQIASAQEPEVEGWAYRLADELMSPYCPGRTLAECPSQQAETLRMWLIVQESAGRSEEEVTAELLERFGDQLLAAPRPEGFGLAAYVVPVVLFLAGGLLIAVFLRRQTAGGPADADGSGARDALSPLDPELERLVDEDLAR